MPLLSFDDYCAEISTQTEQLGAALTGHDMRTAVPSCPGWNVGQLVRHLGHAHRWTAEIIAAGPAGDPPPEDGVRILDRFDREVSAELAGWLVQSAEVLVERLRAAGPHATVWTPIPGVTPTASFYARRMTHETVIHRADGVLALEGRYLLDPYVAVDAIDEWMELGSLPHMITIKPELGELLAPGRTLHLHATDAPADADAEWVVDLSGHNLSWRKGHEKCSAAIRASLVDLLLVLYRRRSPAVETVDIVGDRGLVEYWLARVPFG
jgi:uncharacterized protein (TIGR03083 family)